LLSLSLSLSLLLSAPVRRLRLVDGIDGFDVVELLSLSLSLSLSLLLSAPVRRLRLVDGIDGFDVVDGIGRSVVGLLSLSLSLSLSLLSLSLLFSSSLSLSLSLLFSSPVRRLRLVDGIHGFDVGGALAVVVVGDSEMSQVRKELPPLSLHFPQFICCGFWRGFWGK
jgi:hypothetical protein